MYPFIAHRLQNGVDKGEGRRWMFSCIVLFTPVLRLQLDWEVLSHEYEPKLSVDGCLHCALQEL